MKVRKGFVSNSSTTSFLCDYCGEERAGMEMCLEDACMYECVNGHTFCGSHVELDSSPEAQKLIINKMLVGQAAKYFELAKGDEKERYEKYANETLTDCHKMMSLKGEELEDWIANEGEDYVCSLQYEIPSDYCPCCKFKGIAADDMIAYLLAICKLDKKRTKKEMRKKLKDLGSYDDFKTWCKGRSS